MIDAFSTDQVLVRYVRTGSSGEESLEPLLSQLEPEERVRAARFMFPKDRLAFALGRVLIRRILSDLGVEHRATRELVLNSYGKPALPKSAGPRRFTFNISHCTGLVAAAFALDREVGLDVEFLHSIARDLYIARSFFAPSEVEHLESLPVEERQRTFLSFWTLKEAYIKARGMGLAIPLADFSFTLNPVRVAFSPRIADDPAKWFFWQMQPATLHLLAVAAERGVDEDLTVCPREVEFHSLL